MIRVELFFIARRPSADTIPFWEAHQDVEELVQSGVIVMRYYVVVFLNVMDIKRLIMRGKIWIPQVYSFITMANQSGQKPRSESVQE
jgi:hypothetical protein